MIISQVIELQPSDRQEWAFRSHAAAARIARNDLIALWREEGRRLKGFRFKTVELRPGSSTQPTPGSGSRARTP